MTRAVKTMARLALGAALAAGPLSAAAERPSGGMSLRLGLCGGFAGRTVEWDKGDDGSKVKTGLAGIAADVRLARGFELSLFAGMAFTDPDGAVFPRLPITLEYGAGAIRGLAFGAVLRKSLFVFGDFETGARAGIVTSTGSSKTWPIEGFAVDGEAEGRPKWTEIEVGPTVAYTGYRGFTPYLGLSVSLFRGDFRMAEKLGDLEGEQSRKLAEKGALKVTAGASLDLGHGIVIDGEAGIVPVKGGTDLRAAVRFMYGF